MKSITHLRRLIEQVPPRLEKFDGELVNRKHAPEQWSPKEELGHLLDSAVNNHQRIVRGQLQDNPAMPGYEQNAWVDLHHYQQRNWPELIALWTAFNRQLLAAAESAPDSAWSRTCSVADSGPLTLQFVFEDYIRHILHHLEHIGITVSDLRTEN